MPTDIFLIMGPTASGKSDLALEKARALSGEIINADSRQLYKDLPILSAHPDRQMQEGAPHHLYGLLSPDETLNVAEWCQKAAQQVKEIWGRGKQAILVGGTGLYFKVLLEGLPQIPEISAATKEKAAEMYQEEGLSGIYAFLGQYERVRCHPSDRDRLMRALEVYLETGQTLTSFWQEKSVPFLQCMPDVTLLMPPREEVRHRIALRQKAMLTGGALEEVARVLEQDLKVLAPGFEKTIGFQELRAYMKGIHPLSDAETLMLNRTNQYAKRQQTWLRHQTKSIAFTGKT